MQHHLTALLADIGWQALFVAAICVLAAVSFAVAYALKIPGISR